MKKIFLKYGLFMVMAFSMVLSLPNKAEALLCGCSTMQYGGSRTTLGNEYTTEQQCSQACRTASPDYRFYSFGGLTRPIMESQNVMCNCSSGRGSLSHRFEPDVFHVEIELNRESACVEVCREHGAEYYSYNNGEYIRVDLPTGGDSGGPQMANRLVPGQTTDNSGLIKCGRPGQNMCTLCDLIKGINDIVQFLMKISIGIALLAITIGGILYIVSSGDSGMMDKAKSAIKNALIGFIIVFSAYLIVNTTIVYLGTKTDLGISAHWGTFDCNRTVQ